MSATPATPRTDGDQPCSSVDQARMDFNQRFDRDASPTTLDTTGTQHRQWVFERTVKHAIERLGHCWTPGDGAMTDFALARVGEIAILCRYAAGTGKITRDILHNAAKTVIEYWRPRCPEFIFCVDFPTGA
jgi:hypothetical protein